MKYLIVIISFMMFDVNISRLLKLSGCEQLYGIIYILTQKAKKYTHPHNIIFHSSLLEKKDLSGIFGTLGTESY